MNYYYVKYKNNIAISVAKIEENSPRVIMNEVKGMGFSEIDKKKYDSIYQSITSGAYSVVVKAYLRFYVRNGYSIS